LWRIGTLGTNARLPSVLAVLSGLEAVLVARGIFAPVSYDANSTAPGTGREYDIVGEILMPATELQAITLEDLDDVNAAADLFKVTPSALAVRAMRLGRLTCQWPIVCAHGRPASMPAGGHENCPLMATRSAHQMFGGVGHVGVLV
jgi:hypothetical protein